MAISAFTFPKHSKAITQVRQNGALFIAIAGCTPVFKKATPQNHSIPRSWAIATVLYMCHVQPPLH